MRLHDAFDDMKNKYARWIEDIIRKLNNPDIIYDTTEEHRRGDIYPEETNYTVTDHYNRTQDPNILLRLLESLYNEQNQLREAIMRVCGGKEIDLEWDATIYLERKEVLKVLGRLKTMKERVTYETVQGYKINDKDVQVPYDLHIRKTYIPDFDQEKIAEMYDEMHQKFMEERYVNASLLEEEVLFETSYYPFDDLECVYDVFEKQIQEA